MDWRQNMGVKIENELFKPYEQKEQKEQKGDLGASGEGFATIATIAHKGRKVKNMNISVWCPYKGQPRWVSLAACEWHRHRQDPECRGCVPKVG